jgi:hypothetical protein
MVHYPEVSLFDCKCTKRGDETSLFQRLLELSHKGLTLAKPTTYKSLLEIVSL